MLEVSWHIFLMAIILALDSNLTFKPEYRHPNVPAVTCNAVLCEQSFMFKFQHLYSLLFSVLVDMRKRVIQASHFMLQMLQTSLYPKESEQVDENVNKNLPDQNDVDFGEGGLAICIVAEEGYVSKSEIVDAEITLEICWRMKTGRKNLLLMEK
ncbi:hypothetical protein Tco_0607988 [Tanacetum coccineum]